MNTTNRFTCLLVVLFSCVWMTSVEASQTRYLSLSGCFERVGGNVPFGVTDCFEGRLGYQQDAAELVSVTEFWVDIDGQRIDLENFSEVNLEEPVNSESIWRLRIEVSGSGTFGVYELTSIGLDFDLWNDKYSFGIDFGTQQDYANGPITGGTIMHYPASAPLVDMNVGLNDAWYNPETDGQGCFPTVFPVINKVTVNCFTYDTFLPSEDAMVNLGDPGQRWLTSLGLIEGNQSEATVHSSKGGLFNDSKETENVEYGTFLVTFDTCNSGTIEYDFPSINETGVLPLQRVAGDNTGLCEKLALGAQAEEAL